MFAIGAISATTNFGHNSDGHWHFSKPPVIATSRVRANNLSSPACDRARVRVAPVDTTAVVVQRAHGAEQPQNRDGEVFKPGVVVVIFGA